jgi:sodium transport system permease protein
MKKELRDSARDRRAVASLLLFPLFGPVLVSLMLAQVVERATDERSVELPVVGADRAPGLMQYLGERGITVASPPGDPLRAVSEHKSDVVLVIGEDFESSFRGGRPAPVQLVVDEARDEARSSVGRVRAALDSYSRTVGALRLLAHGANPDLSRALSIDEVDLSTPQSRAALFLTFVPMFVLLAAFMGGMHSATDSTAGERERGSLEPLLLTPVARRDLVLGKWLAAVVFAALAVLTTLGCTALALGRVPLGRFGMTARLDTTQVLFVALAVLPVALLTCGLQVLVASFARTVKEAQIYMSLLVLLPLMPALLLSLRPMKQELWMMVVPVLGQQALVMGVMRGEPVNLLAFVIAGISAAVLGLSCVAATAALFRRERIVYGR